MKIRSCHVENFGKISDLNLNFEDGINVIKEPNAWGKSTLATFIKVMFYGFDNKKEPGAIEKERNRYRPWQGGVYGGELDFSVGNRNYRISRTFGETEKYDEFHIYDLSTNLETKDFSNKVGEELFDLDSASFKRSIYIAQSDCESHTSDGINAKLGNLAENTNDINNFESAKEQLKSLMNQLNPNRVTGSISKRKNHLTELTQELKTLESAESAVQELRQKKTASEAKKDEIWKKRDELARDLRLASEQSRKLEQRKRYQQLCDDCDERNKVLEAYQQLFPNGVPKEEELLEQVKLAQKIEEEQALLHHLESSQEEKQRNQYLTDVFGKEGVPTSEDIEEKIKEALRLSILNEENTRLLTQLSERERKTLQDKTPTIEKVSGVNAMMLVGIILELLGVAGIIVGIVFADTLKYTGIIMALVCAILVIATITLALGIKQRNAKADENRSKSLEWEALRKDRQEDILRIQKQLALKDKDIQGTTEKVQSFLAKYQLSADNGDYSARLYELKNLTQEYERFDVKQQRYNKTQENLKNYKESLEAFGRKVGIAFKGEDVTADVILLQTEAAKYQLAKKAVEEMQSKKAEFEAKVDVASLNVNAKDIDSLEVINTQIHELDKEIESMRSTIEHYNRQLENVQEQLDLKDDKQQELAACQIVQEEEMKKFNTLSLTKDFLQSAKEKFTARYMDPLSNAFEKYYSMIMNQEEKDWSIDADLSLKKREQGELRDTKWLSAGYQDLIGVCMRLALVDAMFQDEKPFLILDDPFVNLDEEKSKKGMELLQEVAKEYQTVYFTCHESREPVIE